MESFYLKLQIWRIMPCLSVEQTNSRPRKQSLYHHTANNLYFRAAMTFLTSMDPLLMTTPENWTLDWTTRSFHSEQAQITRDLVINLLFGFAGLVCVLFNGFMLILYAKDCNLRRHISYMMLQLFIFCMIHGLVIGVVFVLNRVLRYTMPPWWCVAGNLLIAFFDDYILVLLPLLAIERYLSIKYPFLSKRKAKRWTIGSTIFSILFIAIVALLPQAPFLGVPKRVETLPHHPEILRERQRYFEAIACWGNLNKLNVASPVILLILQIFCMTTVVGIYLRMYYIAKERLTRFSSMTATKQRKMKRAAISVMLVALVFFLMTMPYGVLLQVVELCYVGYFDMEACRYSSMNLKFAFGFLAYMGNFFAPLLFTLFNPKVRRRLIGALHFHDPHDTTVFTTDSKPHHHQTTVDHLNNIRKSQEYSSGNSNGNSSSSCVNSKRNSSNPAALHDQPYIG